MGMVLPMNYVEVEQEEMMYLDGGGPVGLIVNLTKSTRNKGAWLGGAFVGGYVAYHLRPLAALGNGVGAGAVAIISAAAAGLVGTAIKKGMKRVPLLHNAPGSFTWIKEVTI